MMLLEPLVGREFHILHLKPGFEAGNVVKHLRATGYRGGLRSNLMHAFDHAQITEGLRHILNRKTGIRRD